MQRESPCETRDGDKDVFDPLARIVAEAIEEAVNRHGKPLDVHLLGTLLDRTGRRTARALREWALPVEGREQTVAELTPADAAPAPTGGENG